MHHPGRLSSSSFIPSSFSFSSSTIFSPSSPSSPSCSSSSSYLSPQPTDSATNSGVWRVRGRVITIFTCECILWIRMISPRYIDMIRLLHWPRILAVLKPCTLCVDERVNDDVIYTLGKRLAEYSRLIGGIPTKDQQSCLLRERGSVAGNLCGPTYLKVIFLLFIRVLFDSLS